MHYSACDYITDLFQNSIEAGASLVVIELNNVLDELEVIVSDNGKGMDKQTLEKAKDPFYSQEGKHDKRKVGLGLPFIIQAVETLSGEFEINSEPEMGTSIRFSYNSENVDAPELGDIVQLLVSIFAIDGDSEIIFKRTVGSKSYQIKRSELNQVLQDNDAGALLLMKKYFQGLEENVYGCMCTA